MSNNQMSLDSKMVLLRNELRRAQVLAEQRQGQQNFRPDFNADGQDGQHI